MISDAYHRLFYDVSYIPAVKVRILKGLFHHGVCWKSFSGHVHIRKDLTH